MSQALDEAKRLANSDPTGNAVAWAIIAIVEELKYTNTLLDAVLNCMHQGVNVYNKNG